jgi:radical SAM-linked protein
MNDTIYRMRIHYKRGAELRYVGNLDLQLVWERTIRRAHLPVAFSQGFSPRPRFHMAAALPLGFTSRCELLDIWLNEALESEALRAAIQHASPPGLLIQSVEPVDLRLPALQTQVEASEYVALLREVPADLDVPAAVQNLLERVEIPRVWRNKNYNLRPLIHMLEYIPQPAGEYPQLHMILRAREGSTGRPEEVLAELGLEATTARIERINLLLNTGESSPAPTPQAV